MYKGNPFQSDGGPLKVNTRTFNRDDDKIPAHTEGKVLVSSFVDEYSNVLAASGICNIAYYVSQLQYASTTKLSCSVFMVCLKLQAGS